jgi:hypothetical protein
MFMMYGIITTIIQSDRDGAPLDGGTVGGGGEGKQSRKKRERERKREKERREESLEGLVMPLHYFILKGPPLPPPTVLSSIQALFLHKLK